MSFGPGTVVITVPGLRGHVEDHWQTRLAASFPNVRPVPPLGRDNPGRHWPTLGEAPCATSAP